MYETLLTKEQTARRFNMSRTSFWRKRPALIANGLQEVDLGGTKRYREASINAMIKEAAEKGIDLGKIGRIRKSNRK